MGGGEEDIRARFRAAVGERRRGPGLSRKQLGFLAGLHATYVSGVERGRRNESLVNVGRLADALALPPSRLLAGAGF